MPYAPAMVPPSGFCPSAVVATTEAKQLGQRYMVPPYTNPMARSCEQPLHCAVRHAVARPCAASVKDDAIALTELNAHCSR